MNLMANMLTPSEIQAAKEAGFEYHMHEDNFYLKRHSDHARIWPHGQVFISAFIRGGRFVCRRRYTDLNRALYRQFGDTYDGE